MQFFLNITLGGIATGMIVAAVALGLVLIFRATNIVNFAQGAMAMMTTYIAYAVLHQGSGYWLAFVAALATGLLFGALTQVVLIRPLQGKSPLNAIIVTFGFLIFLEGVAGAIWGSQTRTYPAPFSEAGQKIGNTQIAFSPFDVFVVLAVLALMILMLVLFRGTDLGLRMRAVAFAPETARLLGVRVRPLLTLGRQTALDDLEESSGNRAHVGRGGLHAAVLERWTSTKRVPAPAENAVAQASQTKNVVARLGGFTRKNLWTGVQRRTGRARIRSRSQTTPGTGHRSKIDQLDAAVVGHQDVGRFEVPVQDAR